MIARPALCAADDDLAFVGDAADSEGPLSRARPLPGCFLHIGALVGETPRVDGEVCGDDDLDGALVGCDANLSLDGGHVGSGQIDNRPALEDD